MAKWKIVENGTAVNFERVVSLYANLDAYYLHSDTDTEARPWRIKADDVLVKSGFETEADAVEGIAELVKELEDNHLVINATTGRRSAFPGVDNAS